MGKILTQMELTNWCRLKQSLMDVVLSEEQFSTLSTFLSLMMFFNSRQDQNQSGSNLSHQECLANFSQLHNQIVHLKQCVVVGAKPLPSISTLRRDPLLIEVKHTDDNKQKQDCPSCKSSAVWTKQVAMNNHSLTKSLASLADLVKDSRKDKETIANLEATVKELKEQLDKNDSNSIMINPKVENEQEIKSRIKLEPKSPQPPKITRKRRQQWDCKQNCRYSEDSYCYDVKMIYCK